MALTAPPGCPAGHPSDEWEAWATWLLQPASKANLRQVRTHLSPWPRIRATETIDRLAGETKPDGLLACLECPVDATRIFPDNKSLQTHRARTHGHRSAARAYVLDNHCPACRKCFRSRPAAIDHLNHRAVRCRRILEAGGLQALPPDLLAAAEAADRATRQR